MKTVIKGKDYALTVSLRKLVQRTLREELCKVCFIKADGTRRIMFCTLLPTFMPDTTRSAETILLSKAKQINNPFLVTVWDVEAAAFRSFDLERFVRLTSI